MSSGTPAWRWAERLSGDLTGEREALGQRVITDSRAGVRPGDVFVGLTGPAFDGGRFAGQALQDGASVAIVQGDVSVEVPPGRALIRVPDTLVALRALAADARARMTGQVVAITGSNGKTLVKDLLAAALGPLASASPMSWNSQVGVPLALLHADPTARFVLIECGISEVGEMAQHAELVRPDLGVFVNVGDAHLEGLGAREVTAREKALLFAGARRVWVPADQTLARAALTGVPEVVAVDVAAARGFLEVDLALARAVASDLGRDAASIDAGLQDWRPAPMRLEISVTPRGVVLINDAYTSDPESVEGALAVLVREPTPGRPIAVLGGMAQMGSAREAGMQRVGRCLAELGVSLVAVGPGGAEIARAARTAGLLEVTEVADTDEAAQVLTEQVRPGDRVLLKGSRPDRLERLAAVFFDALAPAVLTVDLDAVIGNYRRMLHAVRPAAVIPVVKASGYGIDGVRIAVALQRAGAPHFAVAYPDEGVTLRDRGIVRPILVQNVVPSEAAKLVQHGLSAQVGQDVQIDALAAEGARQRRAVRVHLKVDTGMGRAGCRPEEAGPLAARILAAEWLVLDGLMTHFASADDPASDAFTREQIARFLQARADVLAVGGAPRWVHASNSAGIARFPEATCNAVRTGLALFGVSRLDERVPLGQQPALRLITRVIAVKTLRPGETAGYGRSWTATGRPHRIATVALGYGDGYPWSLSNRGFMTVGGVRCPVVGRVCMDVTLVDVTEVGPVAPGDEVVVFGPRAGEPDLVELAELAGTIPYELLTRLSPRIRRVFESSL